MSLLCNPVAWLFKKVTCPEPVAHNEETIRREAIGVCLLKENYDASMNETCENDFATVIYDNPCYFDKSYDNPLFATTIDIHDNEEVCLENLYDNALDDGPMLFDDINYNNTKNGIGEVLTLARRSPIPF